MDIVFWGVRGSFPAVHAETAVFGGNTACVELSLPDRRLIMDAGTGLTQALHHPDPRPVMLFLSHLHHDHIAGLGALLSLPPGRVTILGAAPEAMGLATALARVFMPPFFPIDLLGRGRIAVQELVAGQSLELGPALIETIALHHPGGCLGFRVTTGRGSVVYATDFEHDDGRADMALQRFMAGADVVVADTMFDEADMPARQGWGHTTLDRCVALARGAGAGALIGFHHDPRHDDRRLAAREHRMRRLWSRASLAREGMVLTLEAREGWQAAAG